MKKLRCIAFGMMLLGMAGAVPVVAQTPSSVRDLIYQYAAQGNVAQLERLKKLGYSLDALDIHENTAYCQAIWMQQRRAIKTLRAVGADRRPACLKKIPVVTVDMILDAAEDGDLDQLVAWKKVDVQVDVVDNEDGNSALCKAVYDNNCKAIQTLLRAGAQETQACMRRVPQSVREKLTCKPTEINWDLVGYTTLGVAAAGGVAALLMGSGGGGGSPVCSSEQRWDGDKCVSCATCWLGSTCISQNKMASEYYYRNEKDGTCWQVAPAPISYKNQEEFDAAVEKIQNQTGYSQNKWAYDAVNLAYARARGYTGYVVERQENDPYGRLTYGQTSYEKAVKGEPLASVSSNKVTVAVMSSGTNIGQESVDSEGASIWDLTSVNPHFYDNASADYTSGSVTSGMDESGLFVDTSFVLNNGVPIGLNFDRGLCAADSESKENCWGTTTVKDASTGEDKEVWAFYKSNDEFQYLLANAKTGQPVKLSATLAAGFSTIEAAEKYTYNDGYVYDKNDPSPHFVDKETPTDKPPVEQAGTRLASIIAALNQETLKNQEAIGTPDEENNLYGIASNVAVMPVIPDVLYTLWDLDKVVDKKPDVILNEMVLTSVPRSDPKVIVDAASTYTQSGTTSKYNSGKVEDNFGTIALTAFKNLAEKTSVYVIPAGSYATNTSVGTGPLDERTFTMSHKQPAIDAAIPLLNEFNGSNTWDSSTSGTLPVLSNSNVLKNRFIVVSSISETLESSTSFGAVLADKAQPCGMAASYCVVAPGQLHGALFNKDSPGTLELTATNGSKTDLTSNSAAIVAGAVALLRGAYPHLSAQQAVEILFRTARYITPDAKQISAYNAAQYGTEPAKSVGNYQETTVVNSDGSKSTFNSIFGRGLIDLDAATSPIGGQNGLWVRKGTSSEPVSAVSTNLISPSTMSVKFDSSLPATFTAFDVFDRPFSLPTSMLFKNADKRRAKSLSDFKAFVTGRDEVTAQPSENFTMSYLSRTSTQSSPMGMGLMKIQAKMDKATFGLFYSEDTQKSFGSYITRKLNNPFIQMREAYGLNAGWQFNSKWSVDASWISGKNGFFDEDSMDKNADLPDNQMQSFTTSVTYRPVQPFGVKLSSGIMHENGSSLGMVSSGAFDIEGAKTYFVGAGLTFNPVENLRFDAMYYYGQTTTQQGDGLMSLGKMISDGFALTAEYNHSDNSTLGFQLSSPLRVKSGTLNVSLPVGRHPTEDIFYYNTYGVDMSPSARELDFSLYLKEQIRPDVLWQTELGTRLHPDHRSDAEPDYRAFMSLQWAY